MFKYLLTYAQINEELLIAGEHAYRDIEILL